MLGLVGMFITSVMCGAEAFRDHIDDETFKQNAINRNDITYIDSHGYERRLDNDHKVIRGVDENGDYIIQDIKTREIIQKQLSRKHQFENDEWELAKKIAMQNLENKKEAIAKGHKYYDYEEVKFVNHLPNYYYNAKCVNDNNKIYGKSLGKYPFIIDGKIYLEYMNPIIKRDKHLEDYYKDYKSYVFLNRDCGDYETLEDLTFEEWCTKYVKE